MRSLRVAMAQINSFVGDLKYNHQKIVEYIKKAQNAQADIVSFPELSITGYPPEDLVFKPAFVRENIKEVKEIAKEFSDIVIVLGFVDLQDNKLYNSAAILHAGRIQGVYHKRQLPNYGVFDEKRYFSEGNEYLVFELNGVNVGVNICEDIWHEKPSKHLVACGAAEVLININSSPYNLAKLEARKKNLEMRSRENRVFIAYNNLIDGQDELVFDGASMFFNKEGELIKQGKQFAEDLVVEDLVFSERKRKPSKETADCRLKRFSIKTPIKKRQAIKSKIQPKLSREAEIYKALVLGVKAYVRKNSFNKALVALSGGVDSALSLAIAVDALGSENLLALYLPTRFSSKESAIDAFLLAKNLSVEIKEIDIEEIFQKYLTDLEPYFKGRTFDKTEENIQARIRGNIAMAFSNKFGYIVLSTGNKSELSVGYATLYGDMAGGFAVLKDIYKTVVYKLAAYRNSLNKIIPERILTKAPSAELRQNQKDQDTLPDYSLLDAILKLYIEEFKAANEIINAGFDKEIVYKVIKMVDANEYKRRQAPLGIKITPRAFGRDRRMPITQGYFSKQ